MGPTAEFEGLRVILKELMHSAARNKQERAFMKRLLQEMEGAEEGMGGNANPNVVDTKRGYALLPRAVPKDRPAGRDGKYAWVANVFGRLREPGDFIHPGRMTSDEVMANRVANVGFGNLQESRDRAYRAHEHNRVWGGFGGDNVNTRVSNLEAESANRWVLQNLGR